MLKILFFALAFLPFVELIFFILLGPLLGLGPTLAEILFSALLGLYLLKIHSRLNLAQADALARAGQTPALEVLQGLVVAASGILLIIPGFFSDVLGLILFLSSLNRNWLRQLTASLIPSQTGAARSSRATGPSVIEGEYRREED